MKNTADVREIAALIKPGQKIFVGGSCNEPSGLLHAIVQSEPQQWLPEALQFIQFPIAGLNQFDFTRWHEQATLTTFFMTPALRDATPSRLHFLPMHMRTVYDYLADTAEVALIQVAYDRHGQLRLGPNVDFIDAVLSRARVVIAELNRSLVAPAGCPLISPERLDFVYESERTLTEFGTPDIDAVAAQIGAHVASLVSDGDCIQTGIGAIPAAILKQLESKNDLGLHGGLIDDGGMALIRNGNVTGTQKAIDRGLHVTGMALGSKVLYDWLADTPEVVFRGADHTHEVTVIRQLSNFVSVNSAVEIDLSGQVNAEVAGGRQISGTGGSVDFMRGAKASPGGRSIVAMHATARGGSVSRIVRRVDMVTALRTDVDVVVTEYGIAHLKYLPAPQRAEALINVAAPQFRNELRAEA
ncbi:MAG: acetyl-CoA hydrolase/transferase C-terminal domain-containing protein [Pseudomonadota bacterium]